MYKKLYKRLNEFKKSINKLSHFKHKKQLQQRKRPRNGLPRQLGRSSSDSTSLKLQLTPKSYKNCINGQNRGTILN